MSARVRCDMCTTVFAPHLRHYEVTFHGHTTLADDDRDKHICAYCWDQHVMPQLNRDNT